MHDTCWQRKHACWKKKHTKSWPTRKSTFNGQCATTIWSAQSHTPAGESIESKQQQSRDRHQHTLLHKRACVGKNKPTLMLRNDHAFADSHSAPPADWFWLFAFRSEILLLTHLLQTLLPTPDQRGLVIVLSHEAVWNKTQPKHNAIIAFGFSNHSALVDLSTLWTCWHQFEDKLYNAASFLCACKSILPNIKNTMPLPF